VLTSLLSFLADYAGWFIAISLVSILVGVVLIPVFITRLPPDYFSHPHRRRLSAGARHPLARLMLAGVKNLLGAVLVLAGIVMLFTPGQGLITLFVGLMVMNYPGKFALERWLIRRPTVLPTLNWLRARHGQPPLAPAKKGSD